MAAGGDGNAVSAEMSSVCHSMVLKNAKVVRLGIHDARGFLPTENIL